LLNYILLVATLEDDASSSHGLGGSVGPTFRMGSAGAIFKPMASEEEDAFTLALKMVATANRIVAAAKSFVFANALDIKWSPE
jgi:hypothetical protein